MQSLSFKCPKCNCNNIHYKSEKCMCLKHNTMSNTKYVNYKCFKCKYSENITDEMNCETGVFHLKPTCQACLEDEEKDKDEKETELFMTELKANNNVVLQSNDEFKNIVLLSYTNENCKCPKLPYYGHIHTRELYSYNIYKKIHYFVKNEGETIDTINSHHTYFLPTDNCYLKLKVNLLLFINYLLEIFTPNINTISNIFS